MFLAIQGIIVLWDKVLGFSQHVRMQTNFKSHSSYLPYHVPPFPAIFDVKDPQRANHTAITALKIDLNDGEKI